MSKKAMKLALEALTKADALCPVGSNEEIYVREAIYAITEALAKQEQGEPVAIVSVSQARDLADRLRSECASKQNWDYMRWTAMMRVAADMLDNACNTTPPAAQPDMLLTDEEIKKIWKRWPHQVISSAIKAISFTREIEAAKRSKQKGGAT